MIKRYSSPEIDQIWTDQSKFEAYLKVEILACEAWASLGEIPSEDVEKIWKTATFDIDRIFEIEKETHHDIVAFTRAVSEKMGPEKKWIHYGLTSTDVVDTAYGYLYKQVNEILQAQIESFIEVLRVNAIKYKDVPCMGRTHGVHAEITSFGLKYALWYDEMNRNLKRFKDARENIEVGKISGAVGTFANTPPYVQDYVCEKLGINSSYISTQVLQRDRHAQYFSTLALIASTIEKIATEVRHLQRTEVREVEEYFNKGQKGSSAMPHKRNPIASENMCGIARVMRGYMLTAYEDIPLWHERDISHSSAERIISMDATNLLSYMLKRYAKVLENLTVFQDNMLDNIYKTYGVIFSQRFMLKLIEKGMSREEAYDLVQPMAIESWENKKDFKKLMSSLDRVNEVLSSADIEDCFALSHHLKNVDVIFKRLGLL